jgi:predicted ABC-type ATPase
VPFLFIIAGPNGAGKSSHSSNLLTDTGISAFDFDKEFYSLWSKFSFDPAVERGIRESVTSKFELLSNEAINKKTNFAFETNYHHESSTELVKRFREAGHKTIMIYITLPDIQTAIDRVAHRVANGGHDVDFPTIYERFNQGLALLDESFMLFDILYIYSSFEKRNVLTYTVHPSLGQAKKYDEFFPEVDKLTPQLKAFTLQFNSN